MFNKCFILHKFTRRDSEIPDQKGVVFLISGKHKYHVLNFLLRLNSFYLPKEKRRIEIRNCFTATNDFTDLSECKGQLNVQRALKLNIICTLSTQGVYIS